MPGNGNRRTRLMIDVTPELMRRIEVAAASRDLSVREVVVDAGFAQWGVLVGLAHQALGYPMGGNGVARG